MDLYLPSPLHYPRHVDLARLEKRQPENKESYASIFRTEIESAKPLITQLTSSFPSFTLIQAVQQTLLSRIEVIRTSLGPQKTQEFQDTTLNIEYLFIAHRSDARVKSILLSTIIELAIKISSYAQKHGLKLPYSFIDYSKMTLYFGQNIVEFRLLTLQYLINNPSYNDLNSDLIKATIPLNDFDKIFACFHVNIFALEEQLNQSKCFLVKLLRHKLTCRNNLSHYVTNYFEILEKWKERAPLLGLNPQTAYLLEAENITNKKDHITLSALFFKESGTLLEEYTKNAASKIILGIAALEKCIKIIKESPNFNAFIATLKKYYQSDDTKFILRSFANSIKESKELDYILSNELQYLSANIYIDANLLYEKNDLIVNNTLLNLQAIIIPFYISISSQGTFLTHPGHFTSIFSPLDNESISLNKSSSALNRLQKREKHLAQRKAQSIKALSIESKNLTYASTSGANVPKKPLNGKILFSAPSAIIPTPPEKLTEQQQYAQWRASAFTLTSSVSKYDFLFIDSVEKRNLGTYRALSSLIHLHYYTEAALKIEIQDIPSSLEKSHHLYELLNASSIDQKDRTTLAESIAFFYDYWILSRRITSLSIQTASHLLSLQDRSELTQSYKNLLTQDTSSNFQTHLNELLHGAQYLFYDIQELLSDSFKLHESLENEIDLSINSYITDSSATLITLLNEIKMLHLSPEIQNHLNYLVGIIQGALAHLSTLENPRDFFGVISILGQEFNLLCEALLYLKHDKDRLKEILQGKEIAANHNLKDLVKSSITPTQGIVGCTNLFLLARYPLTPSDTQLGRLIKFFFACHQNDLVSSFSAVINSIEVTPDQVNKKVQELLFLLTECLKECSR